MAALTEQLSAAGGQVGGEAGADVAEELGDLAKWLAETLNQWKLKMFASVVAIPLAVLIMNIQFFLVKLVGFKIPKILPDMPWWELLILAIIDWLTFLAILIFISPVIIVAGVGCAIPVLNWFAC